MSDNAISFPLTVLRFIIKAENKSIHWPQFPASALRGLLGHGLRESCCMMAQPSCDGCSFIKNCDYISFFEPQRLKPAHLVPYLIRSDAEPQGDSLGFELILFGQQNIAFELLVQAFNRVLTRGFNCYSGPLHLEQIMYLDHQNKQPFWHLCFDTQKGLLDPPRPTRIICPDSPNSVKVHLVSSFRARQSKHFIGPKEFTPMLWLHRLRHRVQLLEETFYSPCQLSLPELDSNLDLTCQDIQIEWQEYQRFSRRQNEKIKIGGVIGSFILSGSDLKSIWTLLVLGQFVHNGLLCSMGLGQYRLEQATEGS